MIVSCTVLNTGFCVASEHHLMRGGQRQRIDLPSLVALIQHPYHGYILWDTGYAPRMLTATERWPWRLYRYATPLKIRAEDAVVRQLERLGIAPQDIKTIILSHFHADHLAGLLDFPQAAIIASAAAYQDVKARRGLRALKRAFIPALMPADFEARASLITGFRDAPIPVLGPTHDVFGDGSLLLVDLPGHARGQMGLLANTPQGRILFAADGSWLTEAIRLCRPPHPITHLFMDDPRAAQSTLDSLHRFWRACPDVRIVPSHSPLTSYELQLTSYEL